MIDGRDLRWFDSMKQADRAFPLCRLEIISSAGFLTLLESLGLEGTN